MQDQVRDTLQRCRYSVLTEGNELEELFRLRYSCYRAEQSIPSNATRSMSDAFDEAKNCVHVAVELDGEMLAAVRLHLISELTTTSPTLEVFPEVLDTLKVGETVLDPSRFVIDPQARKNRVPLHFLALRIPFLATMFYDIDVALAPVRVEHAAFYRRYLGYEPMMNPRPYHGLKKPLQLLTAKVKDKRDAVLEKTPVFGPVDEIPHANIDFPSLKGIYLPSKPGTTRAA